MAFRDWEETEASNLLVLTIKGKPYRVPALGHLSAIRIRESMAEVAQGDHPTMTNDEFLIAVLGEPLLDEMRADNVAERAIIHAAIVAQTDAQLGRQAAEEMWEAGPSPEAIAVALKMAAAIDAGSTTSLSTQLPAPTSSTKRPASTASTRSRKPKAPRSTGETSSPTRGS